MSQLSNTNNKMYNWSRRAQIAYQRWKNPELSDEDQCTVNSEGGNTASRSGFDQTEETITVDDALEAIGFGKFQLKMSALTGLAWIGDAMALMLLVILGAQLHCEWRLSSYQVALITSVMFIGTLIGSPSWRYVSDKYGRKAGLMMCSCWAQFYSLLSAFSPQYGWLLVLRGLVGIGLVVKTQSVTLYSEFLPEKSRGICIMLMSVFWALGSVFEVLLALLIMPTLGWRWLLGLSTIPISIFLCFCFWLPESAHFNLLVGKTEKAMATLTRIAKENGKAMPQVKLTANKQSGRGQIKDLFTPQYWGTTLLLWFIWFANAFSYYGIILMTTELLQAGHSYQVTQGANIEPRCNLECTNLTSADYKYLLWTSFAEIPGIVVGLLAIDCIGRKKTMALSFFLFSLCLLPLYGCFGRTAITICIFTARAFIYAGLQVAYVYTVEVFPTENRALAMGISSAMCRMGALITPFVAQVLLRTSMFGALSFYCGLSLLGGVASLILPIETLGRVMQESSLGSGGLRADHHHNQPVK